MSNGQSDPLHEQISHLVEKIQVIDDELDAEILAVKSKYFVKKDPHYKELAKVFEEEENFWSIALKNSSVFSNSLFYLF